MGAYIAYILIIILGTILIERLQFRHTKKPILGTFLFMVLLVSPFVVVGHVLWQNESLVQLNKQLSAQNQKPETMPDSEYAEIFRRFFKQKTGYDIVIVPYKKSIDMYKERMIARYEDNGNLVWYFNLSGLDANDTIVLASQLGDYSNVYNAYVTKNRTSSMEHTGFCLIIMISYINVLQNEMKDYLEYSYRGAKVTPLVKRGRRQLLVDYWRNRSFKVYSESTVTGRKLNYNHEMKNRKFLQQFCWLLSNTDYKLYQQGKVRVGHSGRIFRARNINDPGYKNQKVDIIGRAGDYIVPLNSLVKRSVGKPLPADIFLSTRIYRKYKNVLSPEYKYRNLRVDLAGRIEEGIKPYEQNYDMRVDLEGRISSIESDLKGARFFMFWHCIITCFVLFLTAGFKFSDWFSQFVRNYLQRKAEEKERNDHEEKMRKEHADDVRSAIERARKMDVKSWLQGKAVVTKDDLVAEKHRLDALEEGRKRKQQSDRLQLRKEQTKKEHIADNEKLIASLKKEIDEHAEPAMKAELMRELSLVEAKQLVIGQKKPKKITYDLEKIKDLLYSKK